MLLTLEKFERRIHELEGRRFRYMNTILPLMLQADTAGPDEVHTTLPNGWDDVSLPCEAPVGREQYLWLRTQVTIPSALEGHQVFGLFDLGYLSSGNTDGFESLLYVNGHPYQGVDSNHIDVCFDSLAGKEVELTFLRWSGLRNGWESWDPLHQMRTASLGYLHKNTDDFYYFAKAIYETVILLPE